MLTGHRTSLTSLTEAHDPVMRRAEPPAAARRECYLCADTILIDRSVTCRQPIDVDQAREVIMADIP